VNDYRRLRSRRPNVTTRTVSPAINATTPAPATTQPLTPLLASGDITVAAIAQTPSAVATVATTTIQEPPGAPSFIAETYHRTSLTIPLLSAQSASLVGGVEMLVPSEKQVSGGSQSVISALTS
jgi:hypothetical protein